jgi:hypothetical protein
MSRKTFYDVTFISSALLGAAAALAAGCSAQQIQDSGLLTPGPNGKTPLDEGIESIPKVIGNPLDLEAWSKITGVAVLGTAALFGYKKVKKSRKAKADAKAKSGLCV